MVIALIGIKGISQTTYDVSGIPDSLKKGANVVTRLEDIQFEVSDIDKAHYSVHQVFTILNKLGDPALTFSEQSSKYDYLDDVEIKVYDALGNQVSKSRKKDLSKYGYSHELIDDGMRYYLKIPANSYPVTVEYNYTFKYSETLTYPTYDILTPGQSIQRSSYTVKVPVNLGLRFKEQKIKLAPEIVHDGKYISYTWSVKGVPAIKYEEGGPVSQFCYPAILVAPNSFQYYGSTGEMSSWKTFGQWMQHLLDGLDALPDERRLFFVNLTKDAHSEKEKISLVYDYLQSNFRYVSIQLGIGGVKPFPAKFTDEKKYGDCKGLSFYMFAILKSLGVKSHIALINSRYNSEAIDPDFPMDRFNHVILCVPQKNDSIWLECTSKTTDFNILGSFTENKNALLITENGGVLVPTPRSQSSENVSSAMTYIDLLEDGSGKSSTRLYSKGEYKEVINSILTEKKDDQKDLLVNYLGFKQPDEFKISDSSLSSGCNTEIQLAIEKIPQFIAGNKMFLSPRIYGFWKSKLPLCAGAYAGLLFLPAI